MVENKDGLTAALAAVINGHFQQFPKDLQPAIINQPQADEYGNTALHVAAAAGRLNRVPAKLMTEENLRQKNKSGQSVFHAAAAYGHLRQIPARLLTAENLLTPDVHHLTPIDFAFETNHDDQIPRAVLQSYPPMADTSA